MVANIEHRPVDSLKPWARNARTHSKRQVRQIADSIETFGFTNPVLIDQDSRILAGHGRVVDQLSTGAGATADELAESTGWQKHTVLGALSRLRSRGFATRLETRGERRAYWLEHGED